MSNGLAGRFMAPLRGSIRAQILVILLSMLFLGSLVQGVVFYFQARSVSIGQMRESYRGLALQVSALSAYNMQFNKSGLKETIGDMVGTDSNLLWVEFADASNKVLQAGGALKERPFAQPDKVVTGVLVSQISTPAGAGLLIRAPIQAAVAATGAGLGEMGLETQTQAPAQAKVIGELRLAVSLKPLAALLRGYATSGSLTIFFTMIVGALVSVAVTRYLTKPLYQLTQYAGLIASGSLTSFKGDVRRKDELGRLVASFQTMSGTWPPSSGRSGRPSSAWKMAPRPSGRTLPSPSGTPRSTMWRPRGSRSRWARFRRPSGRSPTSWKACRAWPRR